MEGSDSYRFPKLKGNENYESWGLEATSDLKVEGLWWITSRKLKKPEIPNPNAMTAAKKKYVSAINHWEDKNDRACDMINFSIEQRPEIHVDNIEIAMLIILKNQYKQLNLTTFLIYENKRTDRHVDIYWTI